MRFFKALCLLLCSTAVLTSGHQERCHAKSTINNYDANKHSYKFIANPDTAEVKLPGCKPVHIWSFTRLGSLWPENELETFADMLGLDLEVFIKDLPWLRDQIVTNHEQGKGLLCNEDIENLKKWELSLDFKFTSEEMSDLGRRFQARFPDLLNRPYRVEDFAFGASNVIDDSHKHFAEGIWGTTAKYINFDSVDQAAWLLKICKLPIGRPFPDTFAKSHRNNIISPIWENVVRNVSQRLGFDTQLSFPSVVAMWTICRYDKAQFFQGGKFNSSSRLHNYISPWCAGFSEDDFSQLNHPDVSEVYSYTFNSIISACGLISDLLYKLSLIVSGSAKIPYATFYFSQSSALAHAFLRSTGTLSVFNDFCLTGAYGLNHDLVLFECASGSHQIQFFVNERLVEIPWCDNQPSCEYLQFVSLMRKIFPCGKLGQYCGEEILSVNNWKNN